MWYGVLELLAVVSLLALDELDLRTELEHLGPFVLDELVSVVASIVTHLGVSQGRHSDIEIEIMVVDDAEDAFEVFLGIIETKLGILEAPALRIDCTNQSVDAFVELGFDTGSGTIDLGVELALRDLLLDKRELIVSGGLVGGLLEAKHLDPALAENIDAIITLGGNRFGPCHAFVASHGRQGVAVDSVNCGGGLVIDGLEFQVEGVSLELGLGGGLVGLHQGVEFLLLILGQGGILDVGDGEGTSGSGEQQADQNGHDNHLVSLFHEIPPKEG